MSSMQRKLASPRPRRASTVKVCPGTEATPAPRARIPYDLCRAAAGMLAALTRMQQVETQWEEMQDEASKEDLELWYDRNHGPADAMVQAMNDYLSNLMLERGISAFWHGGRLFVADQGRLIANLETYPTRIGVFEASEMVGSPDD